MLLIKKKTNFILIILFIFFFSILITPVLSQPGEDVVPDPVLKKAINKDLKRSDLTTPITAEDMAKVSRINILGTVKTFEGLQYCKNPRILISEMNFSQCTDLSKLRDALASPTDYTKVPTGYPAPYDYTYLCFSKVNFLSVSNSQLTTDFYDIFNGKTLSHFTFNRNYIGGELCSDISFLNKLENSPAYMNFYITNNNISDLTPLSHLKSMHLLDISYNSVSDLSPLKDLNNLGTYRENHYAPLILSHNKISDLSPLNGLEITERLDLSHNNIKDISPLSNIKTLDWVDLSDNNISTLPSNLPVSYINLSNNSISDPSPMGTWNNISEILLAGNKISDKSKVVSAFAGEKTIESLNLSNNSLVNADFLLEINSNSLNKIDLSYNSIEDLSNIQFNTDNFNSLNSLLVNDNRISTPLDINLNTSLSTSGPFGFQNNSIPSLNFSGMAVDLRVYNNQLSSLSIGNCPKLVRLNISNNPSPNIDKLYDSSTLTYLDISNCSISDLTPLKNYQFTKFTQCFMNFSSNNISDIRPVDFLFSSDAGVTQKRSRDTLVNQTVVVSGESSVVSNPLFSYDGVQSEFNLGSILEDPKVEIINGGKDLQILPEYFPLDRDLSVPFSHYTESFSGNLLFSTGKIFVDFEVSELGNGSITAKINDQSINSGTEVVPGQTISFTAVPDPGFEVDKWIGSTVDQNDKNYSSLTITESSTSTKVVVSFKEKEVTSTYKIIYDGNGAVSGVPEGVFVSDSVSLESPFILDAGTGIVGPSEKLFSGWTKTKDGTDIIEKITEPLTSDLTVYAKWSDPAPALTIEFESNGGTPVPSPITDFSIDQKIPVPASMTKEGFDFKGWFKDPEFVNKWDFENDLISENDIVDGKFTLYAKWLDLSDVIPDESLRRTIAMNLDLSQNIPKLSAEQVRSSTADIHLRASGPAMIRSLEGLEYAENLKSVHVYHKITVPDFSPIYDLPINLSISAHRDGVYPLDIKSMKNLKGLNLINCELPLEDLSETTSLEYLTLGINCGKCISDPSSLKNLVNLKVLSLPDQGITNIEFMENMNKLEEVNLCNNSISNISVMSSLPEMNILNLNNNSIENIDSLSSMSKISDLDLGENNISSINSLSGLTSIKNLDLSFNKISDITPLSALVNIGDGADFELNLQNNSIENITPLKNMNKLKKLVLSSNKISDYSVLKNMESLELIRLSENNISGALDIKGDELNNVNYVDLSNNSITSFNLTNLSSTFSIYLRNNNISDWNFSTVWGAPNAEMGRSLSIYLDNNSISDFAPLTGRGFGDMISLSDQNVSVISSGTVVLNPLKDANGALIPVLETADIVNREENQKLEVLKSPFVSPVSTTFSGEFTPDIDFFVPPAPTPYSGTITLIPAVQLTFSSGENGNVTAVIEGSEELLESPATIPLGSKVVFTAVPNEGFSTKWPESVTVSENNPNEAEIIVSENTVIEVLFEEKSYPITIDTITNGEITAIPTESPSGSTVTLTVSPSENYKLKEGSLKVTETGGTATVAVTADSADENKYTFVMPKYAVTVTAEFEEIPAATYPITIDTLINGEITAIPTESPSGSTVTLTVAPSENYKLKEGSLKVTETDGTATVALTADSADENKYTFLMPEHAVTVTAEFEEIPADKLTEIIISGSSSVNVQKTVQLTATGVPEDASLEGLKWSSSDPEVAKVDSNGVVYGLKEGKVIITAELGEISAVKDIVVKPPVKYYSVTYSLNGGSGASAPTQQNVFNGQVFAVADLPIGVTNGDDIFKGWLLEGSRKIYMPGDLFEMGTGNVLLKAIWFNETFVDPEDPEGSDDPEDPITPLPEFYIVTYKFDDIIYGREGVTPGENVTFGIENPNRRGFVFSGWTFEGINIDESFVPKADCELEASWNTLPVLLEEPGKIKANIVDVILLLQYTGKVGEFANVPEEEMIAKGFDFDNDGAISIVDVIIYLKSI